MIRLATLDDLPKIFEIENLAFVGDAWSNASIEVEFYKDYAHIYVYELDTAVVGYIILWVLRDEVEILTFAVHPTYHGKGIGGELLAKVMDIFGKKNWFLEVEESNIAAIRAYTAASFKKTGIIKDYYGSGRSAIRMIRGINTF